MEPGATEPISSTSIPVGEFPILQHGLYANHAAIAPWPKPTADAVAAFAAENAEVGAEKYSRWLLRESRLRENLAGLVNARSADDIALLKNTTEGVCAVANGVDWRPGDNLVLPADEFPSNHWPWLALQRHGVDVRLVDIRAAEAPEQALLEQIDARTRVLAVSAVQWTDGLRLALEPLGRHCRQNGVLFFVDAIQQLGALQLDVQACAIDCLAAGTHKWLLGPEGLGVFYCRGEWRERLKLQQHGWRMVDEPFRFDLANWRPSAKAVRFEAGSPNMLGQAALSASLQILQDFGVPRVETLVAENSRTLSAALSAMPGVSLVRPFDAQRVSGIVNFKPAQADPPVIFHALKKRGLVCALRGGGIRLSPHFYQAGQPVGEMLDVIETTLKKL